MIRSGIVPIDASWGGFQSRSTYVITGGAGSGKTECVLRFLGEGLQTGETVLMVTHAARDEMLSHADLLGVDLRVALREERAIVLRYRPDFGHRVIHAGTTERVFDELRGLVTKYRPRRIIIDSVAPLLDDGSSSPISAERLAELLARSQATSLLTYPSDLSSGYDRRLEPLVQAAAGIFRLGHELGGERTVNAITLRHAPPHSLGAALLVPPAARAPNDTLLGGTGPLCLVNSGDAVTEDLLATLRLQHDVEVRDEVGASTSSFAAIIIGADHTTLDRARQLVRSSANQEAPVVTISRFNLRSLDRARLIRDGADEVLAGDMGAPELLQRLATALSRGHLRRPPLAVHEDETLTQTAIAAPGELLDRERFAAALQARAAHDDAVPFTVVRLTTDGDVAERRTIGALVLGTIRVASGDLAARLDDGVAVYLHGAARRDVASFLDRIRARRSTAASPLRVETASFPTDGAAVRQLVEPLEVR